MCAKIVYTPLHIHHRHNKQVTILLLIARIMADAIMMWYIKRREDEGTPMLGLMSGVIIFWWRYQVKFFGVRMALKKKGIFVNEYKKIYLFSADMWKWVQILQRERFPFSVLGCGPKKIIVCELATSERLGQLSIIFCVYVCEAAGN